MSLYSLKVPWVKRITEDKLLARGRIRPGNIAVPADNVLSPPHRNGVEGGAELDLCDRLGRVRERAAHEKRRECKRGFVAVLMLNAAELSEHIQHCMS